MNRLLTTCVQLLLLCVDIYAFAGIALFTGRYLQAKERQRANTDKRTKRFVYCDGPHKSKIVYVELVSLAVFANYDMYVDYPVFDMNSSTVYFAVPNANERITTCTDK